MSEPPLNKAPDERYEWPPSPDAQRAGDLPKRNSVHSIITALPLIMLAVGLYFYYQADSAQSNGVPIRSESRQLSGTFIGFSVVQSGPDGRHYLWISDDEVSRGVRIQPSQVLVLQTLERDASLIVRAAPTVPDSKTLWAWYVEQNGKVFINNESLME